MISTKRTNDEIIDFLKNEGGREELAEMILTKYQECERIKAERDKFLNSDLYPDVIGEIRPYFLGKIYDELLDGKFLEGEQKALGNMTYLYQKSQGKMQRQSDWDKQYEHATERVKIEDVVEHFLKCSNIRRNIKCPFHEDKSPSMKIYPKTNTFYCFGCQKRGSPINFVMEYTGQDFKEAVHTLNFL